MIIAAAFSLAVQGLPATAALGASAVAQAPSNRAFAGVMAAVDTCLAATSLRAVDSARLGGDGWTEQAIDNVESSPNPLRLFSKARSGAFILFNFDPENGTPHCHVLVLRTAEGPDSLAPALADHLGGGFLPGDQGLGAGASAMRVPGRPFILVLRRQPGGSNYMADIHIMPTEGR